jgi:hypothetical protein
MSFLRKLAEPRIWKRIFYERLAEPLHLNALALPVALFGTYRTKIAFDLVIRQNNAFAILKAADQAAALGLRSMQVIEFGVAAGAGLMNMCFIAQRVSAITGISIKVVGFDTGRGMPPPCDYRDHPDLYSEGDYPMDHVLLQSRLPSNGRLVIGDIASTVPQFVTEEVSPECPLGYVAIDVDYYSSTIDALRLFEGEARNCLPITLIYLDDTDVDAHNPFAGEVLAIREFNERSEFRKIVRHDFLENQRLFRRAKWIRQIYYLHMMDHPSRFQITRKAAQVISNPYLT